MKTLIIKDLARTEQLDRATMAGVRGGFGGFKMDATRYPMGDRHYAPTFDSSITASQTLGQRQDVLTATANDSAFLGGVHVNSHVSQDGNNKIVG
jgi:hypothetical protein